MDSNRQPPLTLRAVLAFGQPIRDGLELVRERGGGTIVVLGSSAHDERLWHGGATTGDVVVDHAILRAAQDDGATILSADLQRIVRRNVMLRPSIPGLDTSGGTGGTSAALYARQTGQPVVAVSEVTHNITLFADGNEYRLVPQDRLREKVERQIQNLRELRDVVRHGRTNVSDSADRARALLERIDGDLVELGSAGLENRDTCEILAMELGVSWTPAAVDALIRSVTSGSDDTAGRTAALPRVLAEDRASLQVPSASAVPRIPLLAKALGQRDRRSHTARRRQALALTGEGGIGKSVLLGQHLDQIELENDRAVVLVACGNVSLDAERANFASVDRAFGLAADPKAGREGLLTLLSEHRDAHGAVTLLIDTVDLVLRSDTAVGVAFLLVEALNIGDVAFTCRTHEFTQFLRPIPRLAGRVTEFPLPPLNKNQIVEWARQYLRDREPTADHSNFLETLSGQVSRSKALQRVCSLPVRLALACASFSDRGYLPEDLTITGLYQAYWDLRVNTAGSGRNKERAALEVAGRMVGPSGRLTLRIPKESVDDELNAGRDALISEGVLREYETEWEFFHQTFAEFAHARWALTHGIESPAVDRLIGQSTKQSTNLWQVLSSLLIQIRTFDDYQSVADRVPLDSADAVQTRTLGALQRPEPLALQVLLTALAGRAEFLLMALTYLGDAPARHIPAAGAAALALLRPDRARSPEVRPEQVSRAVDALSRLVPREQADADLFRQALLAVSALTHLKDEKRYGYLERLVKPFTIVRAGDEKLGVLRDLYPKLGPLGRRDAVRAHRFGGAEHEQFAVLARIAIVHTCPPLEDAEQVALMAMLWRDSPEQGAQMWSSWRSVLAADLPKTWENGQVKFVVHLAREDNSVAGEVFDGLVLGTSRLPGELHVNALAQIVAERPGWAAERLLARQLPRGGQGLNAVAEMGPHMAGLARPTRLRLIARLRSARSGNPRAVWPTQFALASDDLDLHQRLLKQMSTAALEAAVLIGVIRSICRLTPLSVLSALAPDLRELVSEISPRANSPASEKLLLRARLEGRLCEVDDSARLWIEHQVVEGESPAVAGKVVQTVAESHPDGLPSATAVWLTTLLRSPHTDAAQRLAELLVSVTDRGSTVFGGTVVSGVVDRMRVALRNHEDSRLHRVLLDLVIKADKVQPVVESVVREIYRVVRSRLDASAAFESDRPAAIRDLATLCGTLMAAHLDGGTVRDLVGEALSTLERVELGKKLVTTITSMLVSILGRDPDAPIWLLGLFGAPATSHSIKIAVAKALLRSEGDMPGGYADALKDRPDCPAEVATLVVAQLHN